MLEVTADALWGILGCRITSLKMYLSCVLYSENGQNEYILIIFSFTNIVRIVACMDLNL